ncbi:hypothetical protein BDK51DRAFT_51478 [Blyttiomyces helicus]|uniref:Uncharacterized protein n=1 Tax=Blyttiomyces helicus TaxID=388810 RepID=A0A4P9WBD2_9FUNG|nr:hypothetical protein BDK51DRAFT_51478 [Blyttiomyces helicus]|eukprot:RKO88220.1 hypothetical protein BDK51DRAFT_51478 [Blyttiomyces helicus]
MVSGRARPRKEGWVDTDTNEVVNRDRARPARLSPIFLRIWSPHRGGNTALMTRSGKQRAWEFGQDGKQGEDGVAASLVAEHTDPRPPKRREFGAKGVAQRLKDQPAEIQRQDGRRAVPPDPRRVLGSFSNWLLLSTRTCSQRKLLAAGSHPRQTSDAQSRYNGRETIAVIMNRVGSRKGARTAWGGAHLVATLFFAPALFPLRFSSGAAQCAFTAGGSRASAGSLAARVFAIFGMLLRAGCFKTMDNLMVRPSSFALPELCSSLPGERGNGVNGRLSPYRRGSCSLPRLSPAPQAQASALVQSGTRCSKFQGSTPAAPNSNTPTPTAYLPAALQRRLSFLLLRLATVGFTSASSTRSKRFLAGWVVPVSLPPPWRQMRLDPLLRCVSSETNPGFRHTPSSVSRAKLSCATPWVSPRGGDMHCRHPGGSWGWCPLNSASTTSSNYAHRARRGIFDSRGIARSVLVIGKPGDINRAWQPQASGTLTILIALLRHLRSKVPFLGPSQLSS